MDAFKFKNSIYDHYHIFEEIGRGGFSIVKRGMHIETSKTVAIKLLSKLETVDDDALYRELHIMSLVDDSSEVVSLIGVYEDAVNVFIVLELVEGGNLLEVILDRGKLDEMETVRILRSILEGISLCHERGIVHRDMKPDNLLVSKDLSIVKLSDFGLATLLGPNETTKGTVGTRAYLPPEMILKHAYNHAVDMWSIGCIAYVLLAGYHPFSDDGDVPLYIQIVTGQWEFHDATWSNISDDAKDFISELLILEPEERMTSKEALRHPWIRNSKSLPTSPRAVP